MFRKFQNKLWRTSAISYSFATQSDPVIYAADAINKIIITRVEEDEQYALLVEYSETVQAFKERVSKLFPQKTIAFINPRQLGEFHKAKQTQGERLTDQWYESIKTFPIIDSLILNRLSICEVNGDIPTLVYGTQIAEHNLTNKINIPQYIEESVIQLNSQWGQKISVNDALSFDNIRRYSQGPLDKQSGQVISTKLSQLEEETLKNSITTLSALRDNERETKELFYTNSSISLMKRIISLMSLNWIALFAITYGKYGWDVGEPISYLTDLSVDLIAMMRIFKFEQEIEKRARKQTSIIESMVNLDAQVRMEQWRIAYLKRKTLIS